MARCFVGTSGWTCPDWRGPFYPDDLPSRQYLEFYAKEFPTTEINYSFYHLPKPATYAKWATHVPDGFVFAVKASRLITHTKRLERVGEVWQTFVHNAQALGTHLGPILLQFPSSFRCDLKRLAEFLDMVRGSISDDPAGRLVFEFRHDSWFTDDIYRLLKRHHAALCIADSPTYPRRDVRTTDFAYLRFHGRKQLFVSSYTKTDLAEEAKRIKAYLRDGMAVFAYFNNTARGRAIENARALKALLGT